MHGFTPWLFPSTLMGSSLIRVWAVPLFFTDFKVLISLPLVASISIYLFFSYFSHSHISFHDSADFVIYSHSRSVLQLLGSLYTPNPLVLKINFLCDCTHRKCLLLLDPLYSLFHLCLLTILLGPELRMVISWLNWNPPSAHGRLVLSGVAA